MRATRPSTALVALALVLAACAPSTSTALAPRGPRAAADGWHGLPVDPGTTLPTSPLLTTDGRTVRLSEELAGTPALLFFGYTSCPDICPIHLATIASAMTTTRTRYDQVRVVFVATGAARRVWPFGARRADWIADLPRIVAEWS